MKTLHFSLLLLAAAGMVVGGRAQTTAHSLTPTDDTFLWSEYTAEQGATAQGAEGSATRTGLLSFNTNGGTYQAYPLLRWDLSGLAGEIVTTDAVLTLHFDAVLSDTSGVTRTIDVKRLTQAFDSATTAFYAYSGANTFGDTLSTFSGAVGIPEEPFDTGGTLAFVIPTAILQSWIDHPADNFGIALVARAENLDVYFSSSEGTVAPTLGFSTVEGSAVPEPATYAAIAGALALGGAALGRRRRGVAELTQG